MDAIERVKVHYNNTSDRSIVIDSGDIVIVTTKDGKITNTYIAVTDQANSDYRYFFNLNSGRIFSSKSICFASALNVLSEYFLGGDVKVFSNYTIDVNLKGATK